MKTLGVAHHRTLSRALEQDDAFRGEVELAERCCMDLLQLNIYSAAILSGDAKDSAKALGALWKVRAMRDANRHRRRLLDLKERQLRLLEGQAGEPEGRRLDLSRLTAEELETLAGLLAKATVAPAPPSHPITMSCSKLVLGREELQDPTTS